MREFSWFRLPLLRVRVLPTIAVGALFAVAASAQAVNEPDLVQLRLDLVEHIENAFAAGDVATLNSLATIASLVDQNDRWLANAQTLAENMEHLLRPEILERANLPENVEAYLRQRRRLASGPALNGPEGPHPDGLVSVSAPFLDAGFFGGCFIGEVLTGLNCHSQLAYCNQGTTVGGDPDSDSREWELKAAELQCELEFEHCQNHNGDGWNLCKVLAVLIPG